MGRCSNGSARRRRCGYRRQRRSGRGEPLLRNKDGRAVLVLHGWDRFNDTRDVIGQLV